MKIAGIEKTTLIDYPDKIACTLFIYGCNFKCKFCHNPELVILPLKKEIPMQDVLSYLKKRKEQLEGVCITGGEPLLSLEKDFLKKIKELGYGIKIDTNGSFPEKLKKIIDEKLVDFVAMDVKASKKKYAQLIDADIDLRDIEKSMKLIANSGIDYEFRTTLLEGFHEIEDVVEMAGWIKKTCGKKPKKFCLQGFENKGKILNEEFATKKNTSKKYLREIKDRIKEFFEEVEIRN